jgi:hypothetical protein
MPHIQAILTFRPERGPIRMGASFAAILRTWSIPNPLWDRVDFELAQSTAPEAPGA